MLKKNSKEKILIFFFCILPFVDALNGILIRRFHTSGIGSFFHLILLLVLVILTYGKRNITVGRMEILSIIFVLTVFLSSIGNTIFIGKYQSISLERVEKIITTMLTIACFFNLQNKDKVSHDVVGNLLTYNCIVVSVVSLFANITGLGNYTYEAAKVGRTGFFTGSNEPIAIYIILNTYLLYCFYKNQSVKRLILFSINELNLIYAQSKSAYLYTVIFAVLIIYLIIKKQFANGKVNKNILIIGIPGLAILAILSKKIFKKTIGVFLNRQTFMKNAYSDSGFLNYITSGRINRIEYLFKPIFSQEIFICLFQILFGQGLNFKYEEIIEIDLLDIFLYCGFIGVIIILIFVFYIFEFIWKATNSKFAILLLLIICFFSCTAGHIWTGGISGTYFALICAYLMFDENRIN